MYRCTCACLCVSACVRMGTTLRAGEAESHATKNQWRISFANGGLFGTMFFMYAFGLWFGAYLIASSTDQAMKDHPPPTGLLDVNSLQWGLHAEQANALCFDQKTGKHYTGDALLTCACALDYTILPTATKLTNPNCGRGVRLPVHATHVFSLNFRLDRGGEKRAFFFFHCGR